MSSWPTSHVALLHVVFPFKTTQYIISLSWPMKRVKFQFYIKLSTTNPTMPRQFGIFDVPIFLYFFDLSWLTALPISNANNAFCRSTMLAVYWRRTIL
ncbi:hypothetical protein DQM08_11050 [Lactiplantibacillus paraplantarum]|nr:hypothetical protein DQM08_11050 [Lactiplantibacillus paraplantarum]